MAGRGRYTPPWLSFAVVRPPVEALQFLEQHLPAYALQLVRLCVWLVLLTIIFAPLERLFALHPQKVFRKAILTDLGYYFVSTLISSVLLSVPLAFVAWIVHRSIPGVITFAAAAWPTWLRIPASLVVGEVGFYWGHRWSHEIPLLWRFHAIHHSAEALDWSTTYRIHPVNQIIYGAGALALIRVFGFAPAAFAISWFLPEVKTATRTVLPVPCGITVEPRTC